MFICVCSDVGKIRKINQDSHYYSDDNELSIFILADGMGGHNAGEVASKLAIETIKEHYNKEKKKVIQGTLEVPKFINLTLNEANSRILKQSNEDEKLKGMGTTLTMGLIYNNEIFIGHIGDSRAYLFREKELYQLTQDHSLVAELVRNGSISREEAFKHPQKNVITRALGTDDVANVDITSRELISDDIIMLCSDGLTDMVSEQRIREILSGCDDLQEACYLLTDTANEFGGYDNITVMIIKTS